MRKPTSTIEWIRLTNTWKGLRASTPLFSPFWLTCAENLFTCARAAQIQFEMDCELARLSKFEGKRAGRGYTRPKD